MYDYNSLCGKQVKLYLKQYNNRVINGTIDGYVNGTVLLKKVKVKHIGYSTTYDNAHVNKEDIDKVEVED